MSGETSIGYTGFCNVDGMTVLAYGFPYKEAPKTYIRKLTLAPAVEAFQLLRKGDSISMTWEVSKGILPISRNAYSAPGSIVMTLTARNRLTHLTR